MSRMGNGLTQLRSDTILDKGSRRVPDLRKRACRSRQPDGFQKRSMASGEAAIGNLKRYD
ncbi:hypothetical protein Tdes44962_MAKER04328 [Teratosphaeria destructans]|uniref:Uncharacterized protein n=1 Tax=Teratosphaeria destructans TaxID=418781 RepID=A0A9W7SMY6_9PEZI|nr:hypothetical protein Tdes44962_MAKER04328 [Teratosphaeria destructans]